MPRIVMSIRVHDGEVPIETTDLPPHIVDDVMAAVRRGVRPTVDGVLHSHTPALIADLGVLPIWSRADAAVRRAISWLRWGQ